MQYTLADNSLYAEMIEVYKESFTTAEGAEEGTMIAELATQLFESPANDCYPFCATQDGRVIGAVIFSRLAYKNNLADVFVLGPVAVATESQSQGVGKGLIESGLSYLKDLGVTVVMTYGDPAYYSRVGFSPVSQEQITAPFDLQYPEGWLGQSLTDAELPVIDTECSCVEAFNNPVFW
jgi:predicted N-acetyltransferase YhbS